MIAGIVLAGGSGTRYGSETPKCFLNLNGKPVVRYAVEAFLSHPKIDQVIVVYPEGSEAARGVLSALERDFPVKVTCHPGGASRGESSFLGLRACPVGTDKVLIHDGARPFLSSAVIDRVIAALDTHQAVDTGILSADTIFETEGESLEILDRSRLRRGQTPQGFDWLSIHWAYADLVASCGTQCRCIADYTDDIGVGLRAGLTTTWVEGDETNVKITTPADMALAERLGQRLRPKGTLDLEALRGKKGLILGGTSGIGAACVDLVAPYASVVATGSELDVTDPVSWIELYQRGPFDFVIYSVGVLGRGPIVEQWNRSKRVLDVNLGGAIELAQSGPMLLRPGAHVVFVGSSSAYLGRADYAVYSASKAGLMNLAQALAEEWAGWVHVNLVNPSRTNTPMRAQAFPGEDLSTLLDPRRVAEVICSYLTGPETGHVVDLKVGA